MNNIIKFSLLYISLLGVIFLNSCSTISKEQIAIIYKQYFIEHSTLPNPADTGVYKTESLLYGGNYHPRRFEYSDKEIVTNTVDLSPYFDAKRDLLTYFGDYSGYKDSINEDHWGFNEKNAPVNGILWYPKEDNKSGKKYPLVVCMHGNHDAYDSSEFGYNYLGDHLASHGYIFASIDENYLNSRTDGRENDARAVLALEHIKAILEWNNDPDSKFYQKIDEDNIAIIGHSRGGEAAVTASAFNKLPEYPENGNVKWNYNFSIKAVVSIAPVEGQYRPSQRGITPEESDFLLLHGGADGDVSVNEGIRFLNRTKPDPGFEYYSFWIKGANHAQFNTDWSVDQDPFATLRADMITDLEQQQIARVTILSFLEASLKEHDAYRSFLRDYRIGKEWLPETLYLTTYRNSKGTIIADFEEDIKTDTLTNPNWRLTIGEFFLWREQMLAFDFQKNIYQKKLHLSKSHFENQESSALYLQWTKEKEGVLSFETDEGELPDTRGLAFDLAVLELPETDDIIDFTIIITTDSQVINLSLRDYYFLPQIPGTFIFSKGYSFPEMLQRIEIPFEKIQSVKSITFRFNKTSEGSILIDNILLLEEEKNEI